MEFCPVEGVNDIPEAITGSVSGNITLAAGYSWLTGEFLIRTSNYGGSMQRGSQGEFNALEVQGFYPKLTATATYNFSEMQGHQFIVLAKDHNGSRRIIGSLESPAFFDFSETSQNLGSGNQAGYNIRFSAKSKLPAFFYQAELPDTSGTTVTINEPDGETIYTTVEGGGSFTIPETMIFHRGTVPSGSTYYQHDDLIGRGSTDAPTDMEMWLGKLHLEWYNTGAASGQNNITAYNPTTGRVTFDFTTPQDATFYAIIKNL